MAWVESIDLFLFLVYFGDKDLGLITQKFGVASAITFGNGKKSHLRRCKLLPKKGGGGGTLKNLAYFCSFFNSLSFKCCLILLSLI